MKTSVLMPIALVSVALIAPAGAQQGASVSAAGPAVAPAGNAAGPVLTDDQVQAAIARGYTGKAHEIGVKLEDISTASFAGSTCQNCGQMLYSVTLYTPSAWIEAEAYSAKLGKKPFALADVTPAMRQPWLHVIAKEVRNDLGRSPSVAHIAIQQVLLADEGRTMTVAPVGMKVFPQSGNVPGSGFNGYVTSSTAMCQYKLSAAEPILHGDASTFFVVITAEDGVKILKGKTQALRAQP